MSYSAEISRSNPAYFIFLVDQSGSMVEPQGGNPGKSKAQSVADAINRIIQGLVIQCSKGDAIKDYFFCSFAGYGSQLTLGFAGTGAERPDVPVSTLEAHPLRLETRTQRVPDGAGGLVEISTKFPIWFDAQASGATPMCQALHHASEWAESWIERHPRSYPPIVMNFTDGESTDGDPALPAADLTSLVCEDGKALLFNMHLSSSEGQAAMFPASPSSLGDPNARKLFEMSSPLPPAMLAQARAMELRVSEESRGFAYNADIVSLIQFLEIGTKPSNLQLR